MNEMVNKFLLTEIHLRQLGSTYRECGTFTKNKKEYRSLKKTGDSRNIFQNDLAKACFQHGRF